MNDELIADKIEETIRRMFINVGSLEPGPGEYSIFYNPQKRPLWFIVIYFKDSKTLKAAIENGVCYWIHCFLLNELNAIPELYEIDKSVCFEFGNQPVEIPEIERAHEGLIAKMDSLQQAAGQAKIEVCGSCGHDFSKHQMLCHPGKDKSPQMHGWIMCPEENCNCFLTWGTNYKAKEA